MFTNTIAVKEFEAEYKIKYMGGVVEWVPCTVVGVRDDDSTPRFIILVEDEDGALWPGDAECVRKV